MKKPLQLLFERHRDSEPKLDGLRKSVITTIRQDAPQASTRSQQSRSAPLSIREWLLSLRWHLAGIAGVWIVVALLDFEPPPGSASDTATSSKSASGELLAAWRENRRQILQLMDLPAAEETPATPAKTPQRRGELSTTNTMA